MSVNETIRTVLSTTNLYKCLSCNKQYSRKHSLDKHKVLCDFKFKTENERNVEYEESSDIPSYIQLVKIVQQLSIQNNKMEQQLKDVQKWVDKKKKKINVITWLNTNIKPTLTFNEWITSYEVRQNHYECLLDNTIFHTVQQIFECNLNELKNTVYPFACFSQKNGTFYVYEDTIWRQAINDDLFDLLKLIQNKLITVLTKWKTENLNRINGNDRLSDQFNKSIIKLMDISITQNAAFGKFKTGFYNYLKMDMKCLIEYEYEF